VALARSHRPARAVVALCAAALTGSALTGVALAPTAGAQSRPTIASVAQQVSAFEDQARAAGDRHRAAQASVAAAEERLGQLRAQVAAAQQRLTRTREALGGLAAASYRSGGIDPTLALLLTEDPEAFLANASAVERVSERQGVVLREVLAASKALTEARHAADEELGRLEAAQAEVRAQQRVIEERMTAAQRLLDSLREEERRRLEAARRAAAQRAAEQAAERAAQARAARSARVEDSSEAAPARTEESGSGSSTSEESGSSRGSSSSATRSAPAPSSSEGCPPSGSRGAEDRLTSAALRIMRCGLEAFPDIEYAGGWGTRGNETDHDDGRAVDFMIPDYGSSSGNALGWAVARWAAQQPEITYVMFDQMVYGAWDRKWEQVEDRGSDTANHRDHVHVSVE
jgi:peptidoglycan DL-endopeptidase CwlO